MRGKKIHNKRLEKLSNKLDLHSIHQVIIILFFSCVLFSCVLYCDLDDLWLQMFSTKRASNSFCFFDKSSSGSSNRFQMHLCNGYFYDLPDKMLPTHLANSWEPHWLLCLVSEKVSAMLSDNNRVSRRLSVSFLSPSYSFSADRSLNNHSGINSRYSSLRICHPGSFIHTLDQH